MAEKKILYGIIGNPIEHSLSPVMHNAAFKEMGASAEYRLFPLAEDEVEGFILDLHKKDNPILGLNVTIPYKEKVIPYLDNVAPLVSRLNAVNTIVVTKDRRLVGYNTDAPGFIAHLVELGFNTRGKRIAILGAGGSARAIIGTLCLIPERPESIKIFNRTTKNVEDMLKDLAERLDLSIVESVTSIEDLNLELADFLINATSLGLKEDDPCLLEPHHLHKDMLVYDLIYKPSKTLLLKMAEEEGARAVNGLGMLYYQGVLALQHWADMELDDQVKQVMRKTLEKAARGSR